MSWIERLQPASFRGIPFEVEGVDTAFSRRVPLHEYPEVDGADDDDLGERPRFFDLDLFVVGPDHDLEADRLENVLRSKEAGDLIHPWKGRLYVRPIDGKRRDRSSALNVTVFEVRFLELKRTTPAPPEDPSRALERAAAAAAAAGAAQVEEELEVVSVPEFVREGAADGLSIVSKAFDALHFAQDLTTEISIAAARINALQSAAAALITAPADLAAAVLSAMDSIRATAATSIDGLYAYEVFFEIELPARAGRSPLADLANRNGELVVELARLAAAYNAALEAIAATWPSQEAFDAALVRIFNLMDELQESAGDELFRAIAELRAKLMRALDGVEPRVRRARTFTLPRTTPGLILAYRLFDDVTREEEVLAAARTRDPLFVQGGVPITVLLDG